MSNRLIRMTCSFCSDLSALDVLYRDDVVLVALHEDWAVRGHAMVISRRHVENISELSEKEAVRFLGVYRRAERALLELTGAERAVVLKLGIVTPHLHLHIYPVSAALDRAAVMEIVDARCREPRDARFVQALRERLADSSFIPHPSSL